MKKLILIFILIFSASAKTASHTSSEDTRYASSLGMVMAEFNRFAIDNSRESPFGIAKVFVVFREQYKDEIKSLPVNYRVRFFASFLWHATPQGGYLTEFVELVTEDCPIEFREYFGPIIERNKQTSDESRIKLIKGVLEDIELLASRKK